jgi:hypothetical protein
MSDNEFIGNPCEVMALAPDAPPHAATSGDLWPFSL